MKQVINSICFQAQLMLLLKTFIFSIAFFAAAALMKFPVMKPKLLFEITLQAAFGNEDFIFVLLNI